MLSSNQAGPINSYKALFLLLAALLACGRAATQNGEVAAGGAYRHSSYDYGIEPAGGQLMPATWRLENFYTDKRGKLVPKEDEVKIGFDLDGDDYPDEFEEFQARDLVFEHQQTAGQISIVAYPESGNDRDKRLEVLMARVLRAYANAGTWSVLITGESEAAVAHNNSVTANVTQQGPATLAKREAYVATFDRVNVDQAKLGGDGRLSTVQLVLVRTGIEHQIKVRKSTRVIEHEKKTTGRVADEVRNFPVMLLALYANQPNLFAENLPDFRDLLNRVRICTDSGFSDPSDSSGKPAAAPTSPPGAFDPAYGAPVGPPPAAPPETAPAPDPSDAGPTKEADAGANEDTATEPASDPTKRPPTE